MNTDSGRYPSSGHQYYAVTEALQQGHLDKASRILRQAIVEIQQGDDFHPLLLSSAKNLGEQYYLEGNYHGAAALFRTVLEVRTKILGVDHPDVQECRRQLARALFHLGGLSPKLFVANES